jgi:hypothetical protein
MLLSSLNAPLIGYRHSPLTRAPLVNLVRLMRLLREHLISRRTMPLSALGIVVLFAIAVSQYGVFHLADYPIFLGVAAYLANGVRCDVRIERLHRLRHLRVACLALMSFNEFQRWMTEHN